MNRYVSRGLMGVLFTGGLLALGAGVAHAAESTGGTDGSDSVLGGTQAVAPLTAPVTASGNSVSIFGDATTSPAAAPAAAPASGSGSATTSGSDGIGSGTQAVTPITVPIIIGGNAVSVFGDAGGSGSSGSPADQGLGSASGTTSGTDSALGGTQVVAPVGAPVNASGNAVSVFGDASGTGSGSGSGASSGGSGTSSSGGTSGSDGIVSGSQVVAPVGAPVNANGNAISEFGDAAAAGSGASDGSGPSGAAGTSGTDSALGGTQVVAPVNAPVSIGGNSVAVAGDAASSDPSDPGSSGEGEPAEQPDTSGDDSLAGGTQIAAPAFAPVRLVSNRISVFGRTGSASSDPAAPSGSGSGSGTATTSGSGSAVGGTQVLAPISVPVTIGGNTVGILGGTGTTGVGTGGGTGGTSGGGTVGGTEIGADGSVGLGVRPAALAVQQLALTGTDAPSVLFMALALLAVGAVILSFRVVFRKH